MDSGPSLDLSDVFHDDPVDFSGSSPPRFPSSSPDSYTVEMLEREISSLLEQSSGVSASLSNGKQFSSGDSNSDLVDSDFGGNLDLVAVLQAAHAAHACEIISAGTGDRIVRETTRSAPTFHSLMAGVGVEDRTQNPSYVYHEDGGSEGEDADEYGEETRRHATPPISQVTSRNPDSPPGFQDISDILNHLSDLEHQSEQPHPFASGFNSNDTNLLPFYNLPPLNQIQPIASTSNSSLESPKKGRSEKTLPHTCEQCSKSFTRRSDLTRHTRIHTGERPFPCTHGGCNKTFIQRSALHVHMRVHTGEKPHCCEYPGCSKLFGDSSSLARHRRTHTGKRPYKCEDPECDKTFTRRSTLTIHMRTHDPTWESDPTVKYNFKPKKKRKLDQEEYDELEDSVRSLTALFNPGETGCQYPVDGDVGLEHESGVDCIPIVSNDRQLEDEEDDEEDELADDSSDPLDLPPIATLSHDNPEANKPDTGHSSHPTVITTVPLQVSEGAEDLFPIPLRTRKGKDRVTALAKRKR